MGPKRQGTTFVVTEDHLKLLRQAYIGWDDCEYGAPAIDCKRPYGNGSVTEDIAEILGWPVPEDADGYNWPTAEVAAEARRIHEETATVLQIILTTGTMEAGEYRRSTTWSGDWAKVRQ